MSGNSLSRGEPRGLSMMLRDHKSPTIIKTERRHTRRLSDRDNPRPQHDVTGIDPQPHPAAKGPASLENFSAWTTDRTSDKKPPRDIKHGNKLHIDPDNGTSFVVEFKWLLELLCVFEDPSINFDIRQHGQARNAVLLVMTMERFCRDTEAIDQARTTPQLATCLALSEVNPKFNLKNA